MLFRHDFFLHMICIIIIIIIIINQYNNNIIIIIIIFSPQAGLILWFDYDHLL